MEKRPDSLADLLPIALRPYWERLSFSPWKPRPAPMTARGEKLAGFERRLLAASVDATLIALVVAPFNHALVTGAQRAALERIEMGNLAAGLSVEQAQTLLMAHMMLQLGLLQVALYLAYTGILWLAFGTTPGKWLLRLRVVDAASGGRPSRLQWAARLAGYLLSGLPVFLGFFAISWSARRQGWHDRLARTQVISIPLRPKPEAAAPSGSPAPVTAES